MSSGNLLRLRIDAAAVRDGRIVVGTAEAHHLRVRRLRPGDTVLCFDDSGIEYVGALRRIDDDTAELEIREDSAPARESPLHLVLAQAALKGDHLDLVVEKATELGAAEIVVFHCERAVARPSPARVERLRRIAVSAAEQSGRLRVPVVSGPVAFDAVLARGAVLLHPGAPALAGGLVDADTARLIVGPEGGFAAVEVERAVAAGCLVAGLGPRVLRAETAGVVACALAQFLWGDLRLPFSISPH